MLTPTDFIFNSYENSDKPPFIECVNPIYGNRSNAPVVSQIKYNKADFTPVKSLKANFEDYPKFLLSYLTSLDVSHETDIFFPGVRHLANGVVVFERPPTHKVISLSMDYRDSINDETSQAEYYLPIPWQVYIAMYNPIDMRLISVKMYFTKTSLFSKDQIVYAPPIFNFYGNGTLCRPFFGSIEDIEKYPQNIAGVMASAYDWVWNSGFNYDITENIAEMIYTKKYQQFESYITSPQAIESFDYLNTNPLRVIQSNIGRIYASKFFDIWQDISLEDISSITWPNYSHADFFYQEFDHTELRSEYLQQYIQENNIQINENEEFEYVFHCQDDCDCDCDDSDCGCCEGCDCGEYTNNVVTEDTVYNSSGYRNYITNISRNQEKTLDLAIQKSVDYLISNRVIKKKYTSADVANNFNAVIDSHFSA